MLSYLPRFKPLSYAFERKRALRPRHSQDKNKILMIHHRYRAVMNQVLCRFETGQGRIAGGVRMRQKIDLLLEVTNFIRNREGFNFPALLAEAFCLLQLTLDFLLKSFKDSVRTNMAPQLSLCVPSSLGQLALPVLPPSDRYRSDDGEYAANGLHPSRPIYVGRRARLGRMLAEQRPSDKGARAERHYRNHSPVSIRPSLLHGFPLSLDRILPPGVVA